MFTFFFIWSHDRFQSSAMSRVGVMFFHNLSPIDSSEHLNNLQ